jgi:CRISPR-associated endonuclease/helicase Cas3
MATFSEYLAHVRQTDGEKQTVLEHLTGVASRSGRFASKIGLEQHGQLLGLLHDLGKYSHEFQRYIRSAEGMINPDEDDYVDAFGMKGKIDHSTAGAQHIFRHLVDRGDKGRLVGQFLALCLVSHHSGLIDCLSPAAKDSFTVRVNKSTDKTHYSEVIARLEDSVRQKSEAVLQSQGLETGLVTALKRAHGSEKSATISYFIQGLLVRFLFSCLIDADRLDAADFEEPNLSELRNNGQYKPWEILISRLEKRLVEFPQENDVDRLRREVSDDCARCALQQKGIYLLTVPTGGGKTLASLRFALHHAKAHGLDRIIYVIPFTSIIDQNADEVRKFLEDRGPDGAYLNRVVLEHHSNLTSDEETYSQKVLAQDWDAPLVFTTSVQVFDALFTAGTGSARRMHQLARSVLIFDEVQTIPVRCVHMFNNAINFLVRSCGSTVVLCTATQPLLDKVNSRLGSLKITRDQQMVPDVDRLFGKLKRTEIVDKRRPEQWTSDEIADLAAVELEKSGSVLVIVNTKGAARELYKKCTARKGVDVYHLSTSMCPVHRMEVLGKVRSYLDPKNPRPVICVSTQLIEAGVDVDFGSVIRSVAGLDSIAQAAGRCNRNGSRSMGRVFVVNPDFENLSRLADIRIGKEKTERILGDYQADPALFDHDLLGPKAMDRYFEYYFYQRAADMTYRVTSNSPIGHDDSLLQLLSTNQVVVEDFRRVNNGFAPQIYFRQSFMAAAKAFQAIDSPTRGIIVPYAEGKEIISELCSAYDTRSLKRQYSLLRAAQRHSVNLFPYEWQRLNDERAIYEVIKNGGIYYLDEGYYDKNFGVATTRVSGLSALLG